MSNFIINPYVHETAWNWLLNNLVSYFKFDNNMTDETGFRSPSKVWPTYTTWKLNQWLNFDWINDYVTYWDTYEWYSTYSFHFWIKMNNFTESWYVINNRKDSADFNNNYAIIMRKATSNKWIYFLNRQWWTSSGVYFEWVVDTIWVWYHIVLTANWTDVKIYVDAEEQTLTWSVAFSTLASNAVPAVMWLTAQLNSWELAAVVDEFWVWDWTLTQEQVTALYNWGAWLSYDEFTN